MELQKDDSIFLPFEKLTEEEINRMFCKDILPNYCCQDKIDHDIDIAMSKTRMPKRKGV